MPYYYYKVLGQVNPPVSTLTTLYTVPASTNAIISTITVCNQAATSSTYSIAVRPFGATIDPKHYINYNASVPALDTIGITMGVTLAQTDVISVSSSNSSTSFNVFGTHVTETEPVPDRTTATSVQYLVVGGGGGGGGTLGGGGGGGGVVASSAYNVTPGSVITVTVAAAGTAGGGGIGGVGGNSLIVGPNEYSGYFNNNSLSITSGAAASSFGASANFTIETWVMWPAAAGGNQTYIELNGVARLIIGRTTTGFRLYNDGTGRDFTYTFSPGVWYHIAMVRVSGTNSVYINGVLANTPYANSTNWSFTSITIGRNSDSAEPMTGYVSNLRIVNGIAVYTGNFTPPKSPLTTTQSAGTNIAAISTASYVSLLTCQGSSFIDNSVNNITITPNGSPTMTNLYSPFNTGLGGGGGGTWQGGAGTAGASGGGGTGSDGNPGANSGAATQPTSSSGGYGYAGGNGIIGRLGGGGGGGGGTGYAGGATALSAGTGGVGYQTIITTTSTYVAGGGGGGFENANGGNTYGRGGAGGGGNGGYSSGSYNGTAGSTNTGGGGGGGGNQSGSVSGQGAAGGSGIVIIRFSSSMYYPATASTNATYTSVGGYNIYTFNSSGTLTI